MQPSYRCGTNGIPKSVFKNSPDNILNALSHIVDLTLTQGIFFPSFKTAKVIAVLKKGRLTNVNNYHPISLLPAIIKILEKAICRRLMSFLTQHFNVISKFFYDGQFDFRKNMALIMLSPVL